MAIGYNQTICNARDLAATLNDIVDALDEGFQLAERPNIMRLENNDDLLVCWVEGGDPAYYTLYLLDGSDDEEWETGTTTPNGYTRMLLKDDSFPTYADFGTTMPSAPAGYITSNQFPEGTVATQPYKEGQTIMLHNTTHMLQLYHPDYQTVEAWRAHLSAHPLIVFVGIPE